MREGDDEMKIYLTKYVLTYGIMEAEAIKSKYTPGVMSVTHIYHPKWGPVQFIQAEKNEWARTKEEARSQAEQKKLNKIASLMRQINKLERMVFFG